MSSSGRSAAPPAPAPTMQNVPRTPRRNCTCFTPSTRSWSRSCGHPCTVYGRGRERGECRESRWPRPQANMSQTFGRLPATSLAMAVSVVASVKSTACRLYSESSTFREEGPSRRGPVAKNVLITACRLRAAPGRSCRCGRTRVERSGGAETSGQSSRTEPSMPR
jgi:hypothetical protein